MCLYFRQQECILIQTFSHLSIIFFMKKFSTKSMCMYVHVLLRMHTFTLRNWLFVKRCVSFIRIPEQCPYPIHSGIYKARICFLKFLQVIQFQYVDHFSSGLKPAPSVQHRRRYMFEDGWWFSSCSGQQTFMYVLEVREIILTMPPSRATDQNSFRAVFLIPWCA